MKVREIRVKGVRNFGPELRTISFADEATGLVRPLSVLVGSNGSGKSTLLDLIRNLISLSLRRFESSFLTEMQHGYAGLNLEFEPNAPDEIRAGLESELGEEELRRLGISPERTGSVTLALKMSLRETSDALGAWCGRMEAGALPMQGGLIHFPHSRWIAPAHRSVIEAPPQDR